MTKEIKKEISQMLCSIDIEGDVDCLISHLQQLKKTYAEKGFYKFSITEEFYDDYGGGYREHQLHGVRLETDEEFKKRKEKNKKEAEASKIRAEKRAKTKQEKELEIYKKLHKQYKGKVL